MVEGRISQGVVVGEGSDLGGGASIMGTLSGGGKEVIRVGERCLVGANAGIGISLGDDCVVEAGLYVTAGTRVTLPDGTVVKALELSGPDGLLFRRNSTSGAVEVLPAGRRHGRAQRRPAQQRLTAAAPALDRPVAGHGAPGWPWSARLRGAPRSPTPAVGRGTPTAGGGCADTGARRAAVARPVPAGGCVCRRRGRRAHGTDGDGRRPPARSRRPGPGGPPAPPGRPALGRARGARWRRSPTTRGAVAAGAPGRRRPVPSGPAGVPPGGPPSPAAGPNR